MFVDRIIVKNKFSSVIYLEDGTFFKISNKLMNKNRIKEGKAIENYEELINRVVSVAIKHRLADLITKKDYSEAELYKKLYLNGYSNEFVVPVIDEFVKKGYIDDVMYCTDLFNLYSKKYGLKVAIQKLRIKGIKKEIIDSVLENNNFDFNKALENYVSKYSIELKSADNKIKARAYRKLLSKGYGYDEINSYLN